MSACAGPVRPQSRSRTRRQGHASTSLSPLPVRAPSDDVRKSRNPHCVRWVTRASAFVVLVPARGHLVPVPHGYYEPVPRLTAQTRATPRRRTRCPRGRRAQPMNARLDRCRFVSHPAIRVGQPRHPGRQAGSPSGTGSSPTSFPGPRRRGGPAHDQRTDVSRTPLDRRSRRPNRVQPPTIVRAMKDHASPRPSVPIRDSPVDPR